MKKALVTITNAFFIFVLLFFPKTVVIFNMTTVD
jgi:hypothetical protein